MDANVYKILEEVAGEQDAGKREALKAASNPDLSAHFSHPANLADLTEIAYDVFNQAWTDTMSQDLVPSLIETKTVGLGDPDYVEEDLRGGRAYWQGKGGQILSDMIRYERSTMPREEMVTALDFHDDELATNFWGSLDKMASQANEKLRQLPTTQLVKLVQAAITSTSGAVYGEFAAATLAAAQIRGVVEEVAAHSDGDVTILGTRIATRQLSRVGLEYGDAAKQQILTTGQIGVFEGYRVVQVENFEDFAGSYVLPNNELWVVGKKAGRLTFYGSQAKVQQLALPSFWKRWETARDAGMLLYGAQKGRLGRIKFT